MWRLYNSLYTPIADKGHGSLMVGPCFYHVELIKSFEQINFQDQVFQSGISRNSGRNWKKLLLQYLQLLMNCVTLLPCDDGWMNIPPMLSSGLSPCEYISSECSRSPGSRPKAVNRGFDKLHTHLSPAFNLTALQLSLHTHVADRGHDGRAMFQSCWRDLSRLHLDIELLAFFPA